MMGNIRCEDIAGLWKLKNKKIAKLVMNDIRNREEQKNSTIPYIVWEDSSGIS